MSAFFLSFTLLFVSLLCPSPAIAESKPSADLIITNAKIWTVDKAHPTAQAVAVLGDRIVAVGSGAEVEAWRGPATRVIDAGGKLLVPGFDDAHVHFVSGGAGLEDVQLHDVAGAEEFAQRVAERASKEPKGQWIVGGGWDETKWAPAKVPAKELIDRFTSDNPVFLYRYDGHSGL